MVAKGLGLLQRPLSVKMSNVIVEGIEISIG